MEQLDLCQNLFNIYIDTFNRISILSVISIKALRQCTKFDFSLRLFHLIVRSRSIGYNANKNIDGYFYRCIFFFGLKTGLIYLNIHKNIFLRVNEIMNLTMLTPFYEICLWCLCELDDLMNLQKTIFLKSRNYCQSLLIPCIRSESHSACELISRR